MRLASLLSAALLLAAPTLAHAGGAAAPAPPPLAPGAPRAAAAQQGTIQGVLVERDSGRPIAGARVVLADGPRRLSSSLSGRDGRFRLAVPAPGRYTLRAERVGYAAETQAVETGPGGSADVRMAVEERPVMLEGLAATGRPRCGMRTGDGGNTPADVLWEEARKALDGTVQARREGFRFRIRKHRRNLEPRDLRVQGEDTSTIELVTQRPFEAIPISQLASGGYIKRDGGEYVYYAPDADVLLSDEFLDSHCFRTVQGRGSRAGLAGLAFDPLPGRRLPDVRGTLWLDRRTAELKEMEYSYTELPDGADDQRAGGRQEFERLPNGVWVIRSWIIRMPLVVREIIGAGTTNRGEMDRISAFREEGGTVVEIVSPTTGVVRAGLAQGMVVGTVFDSTRSAPLEGARVFVSGTSHAAVTGPGGRFQLQLPLGRYGISFTHPRLDSLGWVPSLTDVEVKADSMAAVAMQVPSLGAIRTAACGERAGEGAVLFGSVVLETTQQGIPSAAVEATWRGRDRARGRAAASSDARGRYILCGLPTDVPVTVAARAMGAASTPALVRLAGGEPREQTIAVPQRGALAMAAAARASGSAVQLPAGPRGAIVTGKVLQTETGAPVSGAVVRLVLESAPAGTRPVERRTDSRGQYRFRDVAPGTYRVEVEHPTLAATPQPLSVVQGAQLTLDLRFPGRGDGAPVGGVRPPAGN